MRSTGALQNYYTHVIYIYIHICVMSFFFGMHALFFLNLCVSTSSTHTLFFLSFLSVDMYWYCQSILRSFYLFFIKSLFLPFLEVAFVSAYLQSVWASFFFHLYIFFSLRVPAFRAPFFLSRLALSSSSMRLFFFFFFFQGYSFHLIEVYVHRRYIPLTLHVSPGDPASAFPPSFESSS